jgi:hypothetical protein
MPVTCDERDDDEGSANWEIPHKTRHPPLAVVQYVHVRCNILVYTVHCTHTSNIVLTVHTDRQTVLLVFKTRGARRTDGVSLCFSQCSHSHFVYSEVQ